MAPVGNSAGAREEVGRAREKALLLFVGAQSREVRANNVVLQTQSRGRPAVAGDLFVDDGVEPKVIDATTAELLGHVEPDQTVLSRGDPRRAVDETVRLPLLGVGLELLGDELAHRLAERLVVSL